MNRPLTYDQHEAVLRALQQLFFQRQLPDGVEVSTTMTGLYARRLVPGGRGPMSDHDYVLMRAYGNTLYQHRWYGHVEEESEGVQALLDFEEATGARVTDDLETLLLIHG